MKAIKRTGWMMWVCILSCLAACASSSSDTGGLSGSITAVGSSALQPLVEYAAERFQAKHPDVFINVQGGGSGQGISQIVAGTVEIGNSDIFMEEKKVNPADYQVKDTKVAIVGMAPVVNHDAGITNVSKQQLIAIFTGQVTNWQQVGGNDVPIVVINRAAGSGSRTVFERFALDGAIPITAQEQDNSGTVRKLVAETPGAISYLSFAYFSDQFVVLSIDGVFPERATIETNDWKLWAYEHMYTAVDSDPITEAFMAYMLTAEVQEEIIPELGYIPITGMKVERDADGNVTPLQGP